MRFELLILLIFVSNINYSNGLVEDVLDVIHVVKEITSSVLKSWDIIENLNVDEGIEIPIFKQKQKKVLKSLKEISRKIEYSEMKYENNILLATEYGNEFVKENTRLQLNMFEIENTMRMINSRFKQMQKYEKNHAQLEEQTLIAFAEWTVSPNVHAINNLLEGLHSILIATEARTPNKDVLTMLSNSFEDNKEHICETKQSAQQLLYSLYTDISLTELKGYTMMQFSWIILNLYGKGNFTHEAKLMREDFTSRSQRTQTFLREVMKRADRIVWRCDPPKYIKGQNYEEITKLLQGYIENEVDLNEEGTCRENCPFYEVTKNYGCYKDQFCSRQPKCSGQILNCHFVDSDMTVCPSALNSERRYEFIEYENGRVYGMRKSCVRGTTKVDSWWRYVVWHCSFCFCICDEQGIKSDRYFNLRETVTQIDKNMVVTGLRFVKNKRVFHLQVQQGQLLPRGNINTTTLEWIPVDDYEIFQRGVVDGKDYHTMDANKRTIDLDDVMGDDLTHVVTGVRFRVVGTHLNLEARLSEYNFNTGELENPTVNSFWKSNDNTDFSSIKRTAIEIERPDVPTKSYLKSLPISQHNQFIEFTHSDYDKDAAQTTLPFIDIQDVTSNPPVPLSGIGIYYKGRNGFGGFIAPKLMTYDYTPYIHPTTEEKI